MPTASIATIPNQAQANPVTYSDDNADTATCVFISEGKIVKQVEVKVGDAIPFPKDSEIKHSYTDDDESHHIHYSLAGWSEIEHMSSSDAFITEGTKINKAGTYTYYAYWVFTNPAQIELRFYDGDKLIGTAATDGYTITHMPENPTKDGYTFVGWYSKQGGEFDAKHAYGDYYAKWQKIEDTNTNSSNANKTNSNTNNENKSNLNENAQNSTNISNANSQKNSNAQNASNGNAKSTENELVQTGIEQSGFAFAIITAAFTTIFAFICKHEKH